MSEGSAPRIPCVPDDVYAERCRVAERVCAELRRAGLHASGRNDVRELSNGGALVQAFEEEGPGVLVEWCVSDELSRARLGLDEHNESDDDALFAAAQRLAEIADGGETPAIMRHAARVEELMMNTIIDILTSAGLNAYEANHYPYVFAIRVECP
ncbi:hypothetical protein ABZW96_27570 [Nocardia sp. NPDC004168]|uniref:hypothetical protein n=1 Tax=Nocardia sp. NPDC004168 TaxID=3154452 RepID=UPI0033ACDCCC